MYNCSPFNLWDDPVNDTYSKLHKSEVSAWGHGMDSLANYINNSKNKNLKHHKTYGPKDFDYVYNALGYRTEEIGKKEFDVLYLGCSFTEGQGLPIAHRWTNQFETLLGTPVTSYNFARGGLSGDGIVRKAYGLLQHYDLKPKIIITLFPAIFRTEFYLDHWPLPHEFIEYIPNAVYENLTSRQNFTLTNYEKTVTVSNAVNDFLKNVLFLKMLCDLHNIQFIFGTWQQDVNINEFTNKHNIDGIDSKYILARDNTQFIDVRNIINDNMLAELQPHYLEKGEFKPDEYLNNKPYSYTIARDYAHPGPNAHCAFATELYQKFGNMIKETIENER